MKKDTRYPYTYSADLIRLTAGYNKEGTKLSRSDAALIKSLIAEILGMDEELLATKLADFYLKNEESLTQKAVEEFNRIRPGEMSWGHPDND